MSGSSDGPVILGVSYSVNLPTVAEILAAGNVLLATAPRNPQRTQISVENQSAATLILVCDRGDDTGIWQRLLTGVGAGQQGADWTSPFIGRVRVYGATGARVSVVEI